MRTRKQRESEPAGASIEPFKPPVPAQPYENLNLSACRLRFVLCFWGTFRPFFSLPAPLKSVQDLVQELELERPTEMLGVADLCIALLGILGARPKPTLLNWQALMYSKYSKSALLENVQVQTPEQFDFGQLSPERKLAVLVQMMEDAFDANLDRINVYLTDFADKEDVDDDPETARILREEPVAFDTEGRAYWYFDDCVLYRSKSAHMEEAAEEQDSDSEWTVMASSLDEWQGFKASLETYLTENAPTGKNKRGPYLYQQAKHLQSDLDDILDTAIQKLEAFDRQQAKREYYAAMPKRLSDRLMGRDVQKHEDERVLEVRRRERELEELRQREEQKKLEDERRRIEEEERRQREEEERIRRQQQREMQRQVALIERGMVASWKSYKDEREERVRRVVLKNVEKGDLVHLEYAFWMSDTLLNVPENEENANVNESHGDETRDEQAKKVVSVRRTCQVLDKSALDKLLKFAEVGDEVKQQVIAVYFPDTSSNQSQSTAKKRKGVSYGSRWQKDVQWADAKQSLKVDMTKVDLRENESMRYQLNQLLTQLKKSQNAIGFLEPVDPVALGIPEYTTIITHPMDLGTMTQKLIFNEYPTLGSFVADFETMCANCYKFNSPKLQIVKECREMERDFMALFVDALFPMFDMDLFDYYPMTQQYLDDQAHEEREKKKQERAKQRELKRLEREKEREEELKRKREADEQRRKELEAKRQKVSMQHQATFQQQGMAHQAPKVPALPSQQVDHQQTQPTVGVQAADSGAGMGQGTARLTPQQEQLMREYYVLQQQKAFQLQQAQQNPQRQAVPSLSPLPPMTAGPGVSAQNQVPVSQQQYAQQQQYLQQLYAQNPQAAAAAAQQIAMRQLYYQRQQQQQAQNQVRPPFPAQLQIQTQFPPSRPPHQPVSSASSVSSSQVPMVQIASAPLSAGTPSHRVPLGHAPIGSVPLHQQPQTLAPDMPVHPPSQQMQQQQPQSMMGISSGHGNDLNFMTFNGESNGASQQ